MAVFNNSNSIYYQEIKTIEIASNSPFYTTQIICMIIRFPENIRF